MARPRKTDAVATEKTEDVRLGKKRARQEAGEDRPSPTKKAKTSTKSAKKDTVVVLKRTTKPAKPSKANAVDPKLFLSPKWKVKDMKLPNVTLRRTSQLTELRPRVWASNREELFAILPEMTGSKCINGVSWKLFDMPMILLDDKNEVFRVVRDAVDTLSLEISMIQSFTYSVLGKARPDDSPASTYPPQSVLRPISKPEANLESLLKPAHDTFKTKRVALKYQSAAPKDTVDNLQDAGTISFPTPTIPIHVPNGHGIDKFGHPSSNAFHPMFLEPADRLPAIPTYGIDNVTGTYPMLLKSPNLMPPIPTHGLDKFGRSASSGFYPILSDYAKEARPYQSTWPTSSVDLSSNVASTSTNGTSRAVDIQNGMSSWLTQRNDSFLATQHFQGHRSQPIPLAHNSRFRDEGYVAALLHVAERQFSGPPRMTAAARSFTVPSQVPLVPNDEPVLFPKSAMGEPPVRPHPKVQLKDLFRVEQIISGRTQNDVVQDGFVNFSSIPDVTTHTWEERRYAASNPLPSDRPRTLPAEPPNLEVDRSGLSFMNIQHSPEGNHATLPIPETLEPPSVEPEPPVNDSQDPWAGYIPSPIPEEAQALINAYVCGRPFNLLVSRSRLEYYWNLALPEEYGFAMMGFFRVLSVQESRLRDDSMLSDAVNSTGLIKGNVEWKFRLQWTPGGEESLKPCQLDDPNRLDFHALGSPWWAPKSRSRHVRGAPSPPQLKVELNPGLKRDSEDDYLTTPKYRLARMGHPDYKFRDRPVGELYSCLLPLTLLAPFGPAVMDTTFPRGWYCLMCGKLNFQAALRQRKCSSSFCKGNPPLVPPYVVELSFMRDPQDRLQLSLPVNTYPQPVKMKIAQFLEGTRVITYMIRGEEDTYIKHVFTGNLLRLQPHATLLMRDIQLYVELMRPCTENGPYFYYTAAAPSDLREPTDKKWANLPGCLNQAKDIVLHRTRMYGEVKDKQISVNHLRLLAWVTAGTKKSPDLIRAKKHCVMFLAFGCNIVLTVWPRSMEVVTGSAAAIVAAKLEEQEVELYTIADSNNADVGGSGSGGWIAHDANTKGEEDNTTTTVALQSLASSPKKGKAPEKPPRPSFMITLVHGDHVVFYGDDFEYSIKREGTSFLLMLSHQDL
ncbi:hypothetical protein M413DRAFT_447045 [Hebeloma cylindrosporum]|uniref:Uncharacterized protein n=1 Tax=Hebeloma cylindrosporum TaxID=76867 RepID=A0A0C2YEU9_HEBCY|nr:hypothetical protein M413DRAFT_447045 [Hebeloma cylindrosporum h7]